MIVKFDEHLCMPTTRIEYSYYLMVQEAGLKMMPCRLMNEDGQWHVAPAYDYTFTVDTDAPFYVNRHSLSINGRTEDITAEDLLAAASRFGIKAAKPFIEKAAGIVSRYREFGRKAGIAEEWITIILKPTSARAEGV